MSTALAPQPAAAVIGASSGIGAALARRLARAGYRVALVARRADRLEQLAAGLEAEFGPGCARVYVHDVTQTAEAPAVFQRLLADLGRLDVLIYNAGQQLPVALDEYDFAKDQAMLAVNVLGALAWLNLGAALFERQGAGHLVGVSSVAGDRGRVGAPAYNTSKAALSTFLEALRNRLTRRGVHVLTVKPGFVDTELLKHAPRAFWVITPEQAAADIVRALAARQQVLYTPARWGLLMLIIRHIPSIIFRRLKF
ncbi:MAG: SDR family NAD(P)-dependent oxidoreductase [Anaerolineales bacterium]|nr:SDR family NAD(P)-dependent oxidoreductase [Anaerolineales bacterium]